MLFHGSMTAEKKQAMEDINSDKAIITLTTLDIAGVGLNLVKFSIVVLTDHCYNPR